MEPKQKYPVLIQAPRPEEDTPTPQTQSTEQPPDTTPQIVPGDDQ